MKYFVAFITSLVLLAALPAYAKTAPKPQAAPPPVEQCQPIDELAQAIDHILPIKGVVNVPANKKLAMFAWVQKQLATENKPLQGAAADYDFVIINHGEKGYGVVAGHASSRVGCAAVYAGNDPEFLQITGLPATGQGV